MLVFIGVVCTIILLAMLHNKPSMKNSLGCMVLLAVCICSCTKAHADSECTNDYAVKVASSAYDMRGSGMSEATLVDAVMKENLPMDKKMYTVSLITHLYEDPDIRTLTKSQIKALLVVHCMGMTE